MEVIIICCYMFLSSPFEEIMTGFDNINNSTTDSHIEAGSNLGRTVFNMMFAALGIIPLVWFILWCFHREPDWGYRE